LEFSRRPRGLYVARSRYCDPGSRRSQGLDTLPHTLTSATILDTGRIHIVKPADVPNTNWLRPCPPSVGQQRFGDDLLAQHSFVILPSAVSTYSWNLLFVAENAKGLYKTRSQERLALDTRLHRAP
jgi:RES domain-containing protein